MWPFESRHDVVRIGRERVEYWVRAGGGFNRRGEAAIADANVGAALRDLCASIEAKATSVDVVLESAWCSVVLLDTGRTLWKSAQIEALLRHRLARVHDERGASVANWTVGVDHRPGDLHGLGFGLSPAVRGAIEDGLVEAKVRIASMQPAVQWARRLLAPKREGWWVWLEQDRALVGYAEAGRVIAFNPAADLPSDAPACTRLLRTERLRLGIEAAAAPIVVSSWNAPFAVNAASGLSTNFLAVVQASVSASIPEVVASRSTA